MLQLENEFGPRIQADPREIEYIRFLLNITREAGFHSALFTSDNFSIFPGGDPVRSISELLETANGNSNISASLDVMRHMQPHRPMYMSEYWTGWFDYWGAKTHSTWDVKPMIKQARNALLYNASINFYPYVICLLFCFPLLKNGFYNVFLYKISRRFIFRIHGRWSWR